MPQPPPPPDQPPPPSDIPLPPPPPPESPPPPPPPPLEDDGEIEEVEMEDDDCEPPAPGTEPPLGVGGMKVWDRSTHPDLKSHLSRLVNRLTKHTF